MRFPLRRFYQDERQTLGTLSVGDLTLFTIERPWLHNQPFHSRVPPGMFRMKAIAIEGTLKVRLTELGDSGTVIESIDAIVTVYPPQERTLLNIEIANWAKQVAGCVGVGTAVGRDNNRSAPGRPIYMVHDSRDALDILLTEMKRWPEVPMFLSVDDCF